MPDETLVTVLLPGGDEISVRISRHALIRFNERVRPTLGLNAASRELRRLVGFADLRTDPPAWLPPTSQRPALYLWLDGIVMPTDPDPKDHGRLLIRTVLTRSGHALPERRAMRRRRRDARAARILAARGRRFERARRRSRQALDKRRSRRPHRSSRR